MATCPACGVESLEGARFCANCGTALAPAPRREERKVVTVLFADLVGFTSRAERLDPEDVRAVLAPYWERLRAELERHGGTVEKFIGDAVMALFGAPTAHEDDPERAVRAALAIRDWAREEQDVQVRIAVTTGEALVLLGARPSEGEGMAAGDVVNSAARLQAAAPVNGILVGETTYRATRDVIDYAEHEPVTAKGKSEQIAVWEAVQARARFGMDLEQRALLPLVGRARELDALVGALERARDQLEPQLVTLVGVPGIGKSRLVAELFQRIGAEPGLTLWRQGRALPYGEGVSFWALGEMVKAQAGIQENDALETSRAKLWESVVGAVQEGDRTWVMQHLVPLIGGEQPEGDSRNESFAAWRAYLEGLAEQHPLVLVFEDLHWADDGLLDFVDELADWVSGVPLLVVGTARPELLDRRPAWGGGKLNSTTLALSPLSDDESAQLILRVVERALLSAETQQALLERAGGNPLYAEQFARLYVERGSTDDLPLPETIQGIIAARLDGLTSAEKRLLQAAAVVGKIFWSGGAASLADVGGDELEQALHSLQRKGIIRRERRSAVSGEDEYAFRHVLVRDVAYGQIPRGERGQKHVLAASWVESLGRPEDHADFVAHHYGSALELARATGTVEPPLERAAQHAFARAGDRALRLSAYSSALRFYDYALALPAEAAERAQMVFAHARARLHAEGDGSELIEARDALAATDQVEAAAEAAALAAQAAWYAGRGHEASELLATALASLDGLAPSRELVSVQAELARFKAFGGDAGEAERLAEDALQIADGLGARELRAKLLITLAVIALQRGELRRAKPMLEQALESEPSSSERIRALTNMAVTWDIDGYFGEAKRWGDLSNETAARLGDRMQLLWGETGEIENDLFGAGRWDEALARATSHLEETAALGGHYMDPGMRLVRAHVLAARGDDARARHDVETALGELNIAGGVQAVAPWLNHAAQIAILLGDTEQALELVARLVELVRTAPLKAPGIRGSNAALLYQCGRGPEWLEIADAKFAETGRVWAARLICSGRLVDAADLLGYIDTAFDEATVRLLAAEQLVGQGRPAEAGEQLELALPFFRRAGAQRIVARAEALLAPSSRSA